MEKLTSASGVEKNDICFMFDAGGGNKTCTQ